MTITINTQTTEIIDNNDLQQLADDCQQLTEIIDEFNDLNTDIDYELLDGTIIK